MRERKMSDRGLTCQAIPAPAIADRPQVRGVHAAPGRPYDWNITIIVQSSCMHFRCISHPEVLSCKQQIIAISKVH